MSTVEKGVRMAVQHVFVICQAFFYRLCHEGRELHYI